MFHTDSIDINLKKEDNLATISGVSDCVGKRSLSPGKVKDTYALRYFVYCTKDTCTGMCMIMFLK